MTDVEAVRIGYATNTELVDRKIVRFYNDYRFLSNFHLVDIEYEGIIYPSTEHAYQAAKSADPKERQRIADLPTPRDAKREGKVIQITTFGWEMFKVDVMYELNYKKYQNPILRELLLDTAPFPLIEGNTWKDDFWGVCTEAGENYLGQILMEIRERITL